MSGGHEVDAAPPGDADPPIDADASAAADVEAPASSAAQPTKSPERVRPAHVVPGPGAQSATAMPAFVAAVHAKDAAAARASISPTFQGKANGRPMDRDAQVRLLESFWAGFPDGAFAMEPTGGSGRYVLTWTFQGTHGGMYAGVPATGTPVAFSGFIIAVADKSGVTSLDWKWDTKAFTRAVLGPDQVGDLEVKDTFRDPSKRWQQEGRGASRVQGRRKGQGPGRQGQQQGRPQGQPRPPSPPGEPGQPGEGKRRRRGKGKGQRPEGTATDEPQSAQSRAEGPTVEAPTPAPSAPSAVPEGGAPTSEPPASGPKPGDT